MTTDPEMISTSKNFVIITMLLVFTFGKAHELNYKALQDLGVSCAPLDSCRNRTSNGFLKLPYSCQCDSSCSKFGMCCIDYPGPTTERKAKCSFLPGYKGKIFVVSQCDPLWSGDHSVRSRCEESAMVQEDPIVNAPFTNPISEITYKNYHCALCNNDHSEAIPWNIKLAFPGSDRDFEEHRHEVLNLLEYNKQYKQWGFRRSWGPYAGDFIPGRIEYVVPSNIQSSVRNCRSDVVSDCSATWQDDEMKRKCFSYMAVIRVQHNQQFLAFQNVHCALCNYVSDFAHSSCESFIPLITRTTTMSTSSLSFSILIDINLSDGNLVGVTPRCRAGKVYDPFFKRCRRLSCALPGYVMRNSSCVRA